VRTAAALLSATMLAVMASGPTMAQPAARPNIVFILMDNLDYSEVGVYGGASSATHQHRGSTGWRQKETASPMPKLTPRSYRRSEEFSLPSLQACAAALLPIRNARDAKQEERRCIEHLASDRRKP
jgi:hypothetical protein